jgi:sugar phosphate isomerase/epimerase
LKNNSATLFILVILLSLTSYTNSAQSKLGGLALYSVKEEMATNPKEILRQVSDIGYHYLEAAGYDNGTFYGMQPEDFNKYVVSLGMIPLSTHQATVTLDNADQMIADAKAAGFTYFVVPIPPMGLFKKNKKTNMMSMGDDVELLTNILSNIGKKCHEAGIKLLYHNHDFEFKANANGIVPIDYILEHTDPKYVNFEMDLYWVTKAGADPVAYFEKYPGRFELWHVKDMDEQGRFAPVGTGVIDFARIFKNKALSGMEYYMVEQDMTYEGMTPIEAITISHKAIQNIDSN